MATRARCAAALIAIASPSPDAPPVMRITLSVSSQSTSALHWHDGSRLHLARLGGLLQLNPGQLSGLRRPRCCAIPELLAGASQERGALPSAKLAQSEHVITCSTVIPRDG